LRKWLVLEVLRYYCALRLRLLASVGAGLRKSSPCFTVRYFFLSSAFRQ